MRITRLLALLLLLLALTLPTEAHDAAISAIKIICRPDDTVVSISTHRSYLLKAAKAGGSSVLATETPELGQALGRRLHLLINNKKLLPETVHIIEDKPNDLLIWQTTNKNPTKLKPNIEILDRIYPEDAASITIVTILDDDQSKEILLDSAHPTYHQSQPQDRWAEASSYLQKGILHILSGPDHILFILALLLLGGSLRTLLGIVTAFTVAHSLTLSLAVTGIVRPPAPVIEPLIALSIVAVAVENLRCLSSKNKAKELNAKRDFRAYYAFAFGLIHGFGFAGALLEANLVGPALWIALTSFNLGVEFGQALIVAPIAPLLMLLAKKHKDFSDKLIYTGSIAIGLMGAYWFIGQMKF
jgi:hydrogenase/urease accessory protein HupE